MEPTTTNTTQPALFAEEAAWTQLFTAHNCSIAHPDWHEALAHTPFEQVELWWPWDTPTPSTAQINDLIDTLALHKKKLVALNIWANDLGAGHRGVMHESTLCPAACGALLHIQEQLEIPRFNLLLGRAGRTLTRQQRENFCSTAQFIGEELGAVAMVEPLSGFEDYPVQTIAEAAELVALAGESAGVLLDVFHLANNGFSWAEICAEIDRVAGESGRGIGLIEHVQFADYPGRGVPSAPPNAEAVLNPHTILADLRARGYTGDYVLECLSTTT